MNTANTSQTNSELPLLISPEVLFPGGRLSLRLTNPQHLKLIAQCQQNQTPLATSLVLAEQAQSQTPSTSQPHAVGVQAMVENAEPTPEGDLRVTLVGIARIRITRQAAAEPATGETVQVQTLAAEPTQVVPESMVALLPLLAAMVGEAGDAGPVKQEGQRPYEDATWVGYRYAELLRIPPLARQKLLELEDAKSRLEIVYRYLAGRGLLGESKPVQ